MAINLGNDEVCTLPGDTHVFDENCDGRIDEAGEVIAVDPPTHAGGSDTATEFPSGWILVLVPLLRRRDLRSANTGA